MRSLAPDRAICRRLKNGTVLATSPRDLALHPTCGRCDQRSTPQWLASPSLRGGEAAAAIQTRNASAGSPRSARDDDEKEWQIRVNCPPKRRPRSHRCLNTSPISRQPRDEAPGYFAWGCFRYFVPTALRRARRGRCLTPSPAPPQNPRSDHPHAPIPPRSE
jgi:hypothetical protein